MEILEGDEFDASQIIHLIVRTNAAEFEDEMTEPRFEEIATLAGFEKIVSLTTEILSFYQHQTQAKRICVTGDLTKSVYFNSRIRKLGPTHKLSINPLNGGVASHIGAGLIASREISEVNLPTLDTVYLGREYPQEQLEQLLVERGCDYVKITNPSKLATRIADLLAGGEVIALFQDRSEQGERALGNRNIITALAFEESSAKLNRAKMADPNKKVAMAVTAQQASELFCGLVPSPYMQFEFDFKSRIGDKWPHLERFARPHIVEQDQNPLYWKIIEQLGERTGLAGAYKSSFNRSGKTVPETPVQALNLIDELRHSGLDYLALGPFLVKI
jgi:carbamoyltransferase